MNICFTGCHFERNPLGNLNAVALQADNLARIVGQTNASPLLMHVNQDPFALLIDHAERLAYLITAVATFGTKDVAGKTFRMQPDQHAVRITDIAFDQRHMFGLIHFVAVYNRLVHATMNGWELLLSRTLD